MMEDNLISEPIGNTPRPRRIYYLDWLRVIAILMVFLFHSTHIFDFGDWQIKNAEQSEIITIVLVVLSIWGMPFFFLVAGASSWFALQRRTASQYVTERFKRLLIPFIIFTLLFSPVQYYLWWMNRINIGTTSASFQEFLRNELPPFDPLLLRFPGFSPRWIGVGFHLWFIGFLFFFAVFSLPLFRWLRGEAGRLFVARLGRVCEIRGAILLLVLPLLIIQLSLRPFFTLEHDWHDFIYWMSFFVLGYLLFTEERMIAAVRRDWWILLALGTAIVLGLLGLYLSGQPVLEWSEDPTIKQFYLVVGLSTIIAFCFTLAMLFVGMRFLDFTNPWLRYSQTAALPFFVLHQPAIVIIGFFIVLWNAGIPIKMLAVILGAFAICLGLYELVIRRSRPLRLVFGMKA
jgi:glucan biosynthesis protein C